MPLQEGEVEQGFAKETAFELYSVKMGRVLPTWEGGRSVPDKGNDMKEGLLVVGELESDGNENNWAGKGLDFMTQPEDSP